MSVGDRAGALSGQFSQLLDYIAEKEAKTQSSYDNVHVIAFSFGTIVTLDAVFPYSTLSKRTRRINTLVTIGCPFDFIRTYWPTYFECRVGWPDVPHKWVNIYTPADVLGSDFKDEGSGVLRGVGMASTGEVCPTDNISCGRQIRLRDYSLPEKASLIGFKAHTGSSTAHRGLRTTAL